MALSIDVVRVANFVLTAVAVVATLFRLWDRQRTARLWWDDAWATFCMVFLVIFMAAVEVHVQDPTRHSERTKLIIAYMLPLFFYAVTWSSRMSVLLTIIRLSLGRLRKFLMITGAVFFVLFAILFAQIWWVCEGNPEWKLSIAPQCPLGLDVAIAQVITDVVSDAILIFAPLHLVWRTTLSRPQKIRITAIFSTTLITTAVSMNHVYFVLKKGGIEEALAAVIQCTITLVVANLSVIIAFFFRITTEDADTLPSGEKAATSGNGFFSGAGTRRTARSLWSMGRKRNDDDPVTSTFMTSEGRIREKKDVFGSGVDSSGLTTMGGLSKDYGSEMKKESMDDASLKV